MKSIGIIGAMEEEVAILKEKMEDVRIIKKASMDFYEGTLAGRKAVVVRSGIGKVNAGICAQILADVFSVEAIINTGIAGSLNKDINIGDIVLSTDVVQHDMDATGFGYRKGQIPQMPVFYFAADEKLRQLAAEVCREVNPDIQVFEGRIASGSHRQHSQDDGTRRHYKHTGLCAGDRAEDFKRHGQTHCQKRKGQKIMAWLSHHATFLGGFAPPATWANHRSVF